MDQSMSTALPADRPGPTIAECTAVGSGRTHNEDSVRHCVPDEPRILARKGILCLVADGMGGHLAGEVASREAVDLVTRHYYGNPSHNVAASLERAVQAANATIGARADADRGRSGMGTTLVAAVVRGTEVFVANVGDSRAYHVGAKGISRITEDHSWVEEQVRAGFLTPDQARTHPHRNLVTRALGSRPEVDVDLYEGELEAGDCLVLCTDGVSGQLLDSEIEDIVRTRAPGEAARALVSLVSERGGRDDASVLVFRPASDAHGRPQPVTSRSRAAWTWLLVSVAVLLGLLALLLTLVPEM